MAQLRVTLILTGRSVGLLSSLAAVFQPERIISKMAAPIMAMTARQLMDTGQVVQIAALALVLMLRLLVSCQISQSVT
ncbi:hypothetical protein D3C85_1311860 [compost metagenome]